MVHSPLVSTPMRLLLVQARKDPYMEAQEQTCFVERCRVPPEHFQVLNVARGDKPESVDLSNVHAVLIGGAGSFSAIEDHCWTEPLHDLVREAVDAHLPILGSCWGHQVIARALGGTVIYDPDNTELGCRTVHRTEAGAADTLFGRFSTPFKANMGHHDRVVQLPPNAVELAHNAQPNQAFRVLDRPVYGTQFHSELDAQREKERLVHYKSEFPEALPNRAAVERIFDTLAETTDVDHLLYNFLATYVTRGPTTRTLKGRMTTLNSR